MSKADKEPGWSGAGAGQKPALDGVLGEKEMKFLKMECCDLDTLVPEGPCAASLVSKVIGQRDGRY